MAKYSIKAPASFPVDVEIPTPTGPIKPTLTCKHRTRQELVDFGTWLADKPDAEITAAIVVGWPEDEFDQPFSEEALREWLDNYPAAPQAILLRYLKVSAEGREKN